MLEISTKSKCNGCHACASVCPKQCITMTEDEEGFLYPVIDKAACIDCHLCEKTCPVLTKQTQSDSAIQDAYAAYNNDEAIRQKSSSGGIFTLLAQYILAQSGVVFGAALSTDCKSVTHISVETEEELPKLQGSKYVQSTIGSAYQKAKTELETGRLVLFTGTPCQIGGLYAYLRKEYPNLYTQDVICHGVPSPMLWRKYVALREHEAGAAVSSVSFRSKVSGWKVFSMAFQYNDNSSYACTLKEDPFMKGFLSDLYLRPSCYQCAYKTKQRQADVTLADFWGVQNVLPELDDNKGTSVVWLHSEKGTALFQNIQQHLKCQKIDINSALVYNNAAVNSVKEPAKRKKFWNCSFEEFPVEIVQRLSKRTIGQRAVRYLSRLKRKLFS